MGCSTLQVFVKPNRAWAMRSLTKEEVESFKEKRARHDIQPVLGHASYLLNLASPDDSLWTRSCETLIAELRRCETLGLPGLVLHPGAHVGSGKKVGLARVARALNSVHRATPGLRTRILLETTAGQGTSLGHRFEQLGWLLTHTRDGERLGVCFDTCHVFAAGYELRDAEGYAATMRRFDETVGLERLEALHLNDSKGDLNARLDRHEHIGAGKIGAVGFWRLLHDPRLSDVPGLLETPKSDDLHEDAHNLATLRSLMEREEPPPAGLNASSE